MLIANRRRLLLGALAAATAPAIAHASDAAMVMTTHTTGYPSRLADWAAALKTKAQDWWPVITGALASPGYAAPDAVEVRFVEIQPAGIPAFTQGARITVSGSYILGHPDDFGCVAHAMCHVVQGYASGAGPGWLIEGIADYVRYYVLFPRDPRRVFDPAQTVYSRGYQPAAAMLAYVERTYGAGSVQRINAAMRRGRDGAAALTEIRGMPPNAVWIAFRKAQTNVGRG